MAHLLLSWGLVNGCLSLSPPFMASVWHLLAHLPFPASCPCYRELVSGPFPWDLPAAVCCRSPSVAQPFHCDCNKTKFSAFHCTKVWATPLKLSTENRHKCNYLQVTNPGPWCWRSLNRQFSVRASNKHTLDLRMGSMDNFCIYS